MPIFSMNIYRLPKEVCDEINAVLAHFRWGSGDKKGLHWYSWNIICIPKREGGLGFKDLASFNQALLAKQVWRIMQNPNCLMARVLQARYFPEGNILDAKLKRKRPTLGSLYYMARTLLLKGCDILLEMDRIQICGRTHGYRCTPLDHQDREKKFVITPKYRVT